jgi:hypothetical protein
MSQHRIPTNGFGGVYNDFSGYNDHSFLYSTKGGTFNGIGNTISCGNNSFMYPGGTTSFYNDLFQGQLDNNGEPKNRENQHCEREASPHELASTKLMDADDNPFSRKNNNDTENKNYKSNVNIVS